MLELGDIELKSLLMTLVSDSGSGRLRFC